MAFVKYKKFRVVWNLMNVSGSLHSWVTIVLVMGFPLYNPSSDQNTEH